MKFLITGGNGFLGKYFYKELIKAFQVYKLGRKNADYKCDLSKEIPDFNLFFDCVIHASGLAHTVSNNALDKDLFFQANVEGTRNLLLGLEKYKVPKSFIFISSVSVYGLTSGILINEKANLLAKDPYGKSKIEAEELIKLWCENNNVICTILRLPLVVGGGAPGNLGSMLIAIKRGYYFNIGAGKAKKSMVLAEDVAKVILKALEIGGVYNLTDGYHPSFSELSYHISKQLGKKKPLNMPLWLAKIASRLGDLFGIIAPLNTIKMKKITSDLTFDDSKARQTFGWNPINVLEGFKIY